MFLDSVKVGDIVQVRHMDEKASTPAIWHEFMGKTGIVLEITSDDIPDCERATLWIDGREADFFLNELEDASV